MKSPDPSGGDIPHLAHAFHAPEVFSVALALLIGSLVKYFHSFWGQYLGLPFSLIVMLIGAVMNVLARHCSDEYADLFVASFALNGNYVMLIFFPLILFYPAYRLPLHSLRVLWRHILLTSVIGKSLTIGVLAVASTLMFGERQNSAWDLLTGLIFATVVVVTDPVDIAETVRRSGCDRSVSALMEANALVGNGVTFAWHFVFLLFLGGYSNGTLSESTLCTGFVLGFIGAPLFGLLSGLILSSIMSHMYNFWGSEVLIMVSMPFLVSWTAYHLFDVSGMLSVIVMGLWMNIHKASVSVKVQATVDQFLETFTYVLDVFVFLLLGYFLASVAYDVGGYVSKDWWRTLHEHLSLYVYSVWGHVAVLNILQPILKRMNHGKELYDLRNLFLIMWTTPRGAGSMIMLHHVIDMHARLLEGTRRDAEVDMELSVVIIISLSQIFQCSSMRKLVTLLAANSEHAESQVSVSTRRGFLNLLQEERMDQVEVLQKEQYLSDVNWEMVEKHIKIDETGLGRLLQEQNSQQRLLKGQELARNAKVLTAHLTCMVCPKSSNLPREIVDMKSMATSRIVKAKKMSFRRQFEHGMLTTAANKVLDDLANYAASHRKILTAKDIQLYLNSHLSLLFKTFMGTWSRNPDMLSGTTVVLPPPPSRWRRIVYEMVQRPEFEKLFQSVVIISVAFTIALCALHTDNASPLMTRALTLIGAYINAGFTFLYTAEAVLKLLGLGIGGYFGSSVITWNRFDFLLLLMNYVDLTMDSISLLDMGSLGPYKVANAGAARAIRLLRVVRLSRAIGLVRPLAPHIFRILDILVTSHLYEAYNVARGFIVAQEEIVMVMGQLVSFVPMLLGYRLEAERHAREISHEIGILNQQRPDIATAVKTRQAVRAVLNAVEGTVSLLKSQGIIEVEEFEKIDNELDISMKKLGHLPHRMPMRDPDKRLRNMPWILGDDRAIHVLKHLYEKRSFEIGSTFLQVGDEPDGIYIIINGLAQLRTPSASKDHDKLGEIYNTDNIKSAFDESFAPRKGRFDNVEYALPGNALNEQALLIGFKRRSNVVAETNLETIFIPAEHLFGAFKSAPELEKQLWKHIVLSVVINIEMRLHTLNHTNYTDKKMRLSTGVVRLARPGKIVAELDSFADVFLIVGSVVDLRDNHLHQAPAKLPPTTKDIKVVSGRIANRNSEARLVYPDYAVIFMVPQDGIVVLEPSIHESQLNIYDEDSFGAFKSKDIVPVEANSTPGPAGATPDETAELNAAHHRAHHAKRIRTGSVTAAHAASAALQMAMAEEQTVTVRAAGYRKASSPGIPVITVSPDAHHHHHHPLHNRSSDSWIESASTYSEDETELRSKPGWFSLKPPWWR